MSRFSVILRRVLALSILCLGLYLGLRPQPPGPLYGPYPVERVVDGDTLIVVVEGRRTRLRLIGVDAPESVSPQSEKNSPEGEAAGQWLKALLTGEQVYLEYDEERLDKYHRTLAYVYLADGRTMVQRLLLEAGHAKAMCVPPNDRYYKEFQKIERSRKSTVPQKTVILNSLTRQSFFDTLKKAPGTLRCRELFIENYSTMKAQFRGAISILPAGCAAPFISGRAQSSPSFRG